MTLAPNQIAFTHAFAKSCRRSILEMVSNAQSGHPGGSLSCIDYLSLIYTQRIAESNEPVVVSNGHISPAVYSVLAELGLIPKQRVIENFRRPTDIYEGHVNRKIPGVWYGTGPLGVGGSVSSGLAYGKKLRGEPGMVFALMGDGEQQEGQAYEMMQFAAKYKLGNLLLFIDFNEVQLSDSLEEIMPIHIREHYEAAGWHVQEVDGHDLKALWAAIQAAEAVTDRPSMILGKTVMGKGVPFMEGKGLEKKPDWHGKAPKKEDTAAALIQMELNTEEQQVLKDGLSQLSIQIKTPYAPEALPFSPGEARSYTTETFTDCRSAYGAALLDLAELNPQLLALTADLADSVKTDGVKKKFPERHIECGIAEQHMVSTAGGLALQRFIPFASTFGAFMSSRAKDQARVNDINESNVKMVATHCGLSVGEDGPTHQAIDDIGSFLGFMHTMILEPADPNQCDRMIRAIAGSYGNVYMRMGRAKTPVLTNEAGQPYFAGNYEWKPGKAELLRTGKRATVVASGPMVAYALKAIEALGGDMDLLVVSSFIPFDEDSILKSAQKTGKLLSVQDHNPRNGLASLIDQTLVRGQIQVPTTHLGVTHYQLSGTAEELYEKAGISTSGIEKVLKALL